MVQKLLNQNFHSELHIPDKLLDTCIWRHIQITELSIIAK